MIVIVPTTTKATIAPPMRPIMANGLMVIAMVYFLVFDRSQPCRVAGLEVQSRTLFSNV